MVLSPVQVRRVEGLGEEATNHSYARACLARAKTDRLCDMAGTFSHDDDAEPLGHGGDDGGGDDDGTATRLDLRHKTVPEDPFGERDDLNATAGGSSAAAEAEAKGGSQAGGSSGGRILAPRVAATAAAEPTEALDHGGADTCPLLNVIKMHPDLFEKEVVERLDPADRAFLGQVDAACRAAVVASDLPCAGTRVVMRQLNPTDRAELARAVRAFTPHTCFSVSPFPFPVYSPLESLGRLGYVESSDLPRARGVVRLDLGHFATSAERLAWAKEKGCRWDTWTCSTAARDGHLEALRWALEHDCPCKEDTICEEAAQGGSLEVLMWAREHDYPWCRLRVTLPLRAVTWTCCGGHGRMAARGMNGNVAKRPLGTGTCRCCSGHGSTVARGTSCCVHSPLRADTWSCFIGHGSKAADGTKGRLKPPQEVGTWRC